ncbi:MAG: hypothetical protein JXB05_04870, partial [Myxococcaceae bacterium]|nr:hypothetical protein [Myxococcaceae bacterium]
AELESFEAAPRAELELTDARATGPSWSCRKCSPSPVEKGCPPFPSKQTDSPLPQAVGRGRAGR